LRAGICGGRAPWLPRRGSRAAPAAVVVSRWSRSAATGLAHPPCRFGTGGLQSRMQLCHERDVPSCGALRIGSRPGQWASWPAGTPPGSCRGHFYMQKPCRHAMPLTLCISFMPKESSDGSVHTGHCTCVIPEGPSPVPRAFFSRKFMISCGIRVPNTAGARDHGNQAECRARRRRAGASSAHCSDWRDGTVIW
jgi:hypothetical protein